MLHLDTQVAFYRHGKLYLYNILIFNSGISIPVCGGTNPNSGLHPYHPSASPRAEKMQSLVGIVPLTLRNPKSPVEDQNIVKNNYFHMFTYCAFSLFTADPSDAGNCYLLFGMGHHVSHRNFTRHTIQYEHCMLRSLWNSPSDY